MAYKKRKLATPGKLAHLFVRHKLWNLKFMVEGSTDIYNRLGQLPSGQSLAAFFGKHYYQFDVIYDEDNLCLPCRDIDEAERVMAFLKEHDYAAYLGRVDVQFCVVVRAETVETAPPRLSPSPISLFPLTK